MLYLFVYFLAFLIPSPARAFGGSCTGSVTVGVPPPDAGDAVPVDDGDRYDATAAALMIGRTTVRYRIRRISALTGHDLRDPETRFQLQLATRAWATRQAASTD